MAKRLSIGTCDHCEGEIPSDQWYTTKGKPRLHCCRKCRNTAISRAGAKVRSEKAKKRVALGQWQNPAKLNPPTSEQQAERARKGRLREVEAGTWRNPALSDEARKKLSRPRKHSGTLHLAIEKLSRGLRMDQLTPDEQDVYRQYRRELRLARRNEINAAARRRYHQRQAAMSEQEREAQRRKWREKDARRRKKTKISNI